MPKAGAYTDTGANKDAEHSAVFAVAQVHFSIFSPNLIVLSSLGNKKSVLPKVPQETKLEPTMSQKRLLRLKTETH